MTNTLKKHARGDETNLHGGGGGGLGPLDGRGPGCFQLLRQGADLRLLFHHQRGFHLPKKKTRGKG